MWATKRLQFNIENKKVCTNLFQLIGKLVSNILAPFENQKKRLRSFSICLNLRIDLISTKFGITKQMLVSDTCKVSAKVVKGK